MLALTANLVEILFWSHGRNVQSLLTRAGHCLHRCQREMLLLLLLLRTSPAHALCGSHCGGWSTRAGSVVARAYDVVVVGGGAAGVFASIAAAREGASVLCLESGSSPLRKVRISGGGRCNVMHDAATWDPRGARELLAQRYPRGSSELVGALSSRFSPTETKAWFEAEGVQLKREEDGRVFPTTDDSATIVDALLSAAGRAGVELRTRTKVTSATRRAGGGFELLCTGPSRGDGGEASSECIVAPSLLLATGSASHGLAAALGHEISPLIPSLFSFRLSPGGMLDASLAGVSVQDAELTLPPPPPPAAAEGAAPPPATKKRKRGGGVKPTSTRGPLLVTHRGISGPAALRLSSFGAAELSAAGYRGVLRLNVSISIYIYVYIIYIYIYIYIYMP